MAVRRYISFCEKYNLPIHPLSQSNLLRFIAHLSYAQLAAPTIRVYLAGLRSWIIEQGGPPPLIYSPQLSQALKAIDRHHSPSQATPITYSTLLTIMNFTPPTKENLIAFAAITLGYFGCLRPSEYLTTPGVPQAPSRKDVTFSSAFQGLEIFISSSKTNPKGFKLFLGCAQSDLCPVCFIKFIITHYPLPLNSPLFPMPNNSPLSYNYLSKKFKALLQHAGLDSSSYSLHSLRAGAATAAAQAGCTEQEVQSLGRWSSLCYRRYVRPSPASLASFAPKLTHN